MKHYLLTLSLACCSIQASAQEMRQELRIEEQKDEVAKIDQLIGASELSLERLKAIRAVLIDYKKAEQQAIKHPQDRENLTNLVTVAKKLATLIDDASIQDYFPPQFLEELKKLAQVADTKHIPPAK